MTDDTFALLAPGPSLTQAAADSVRGLKVIAVSDAYRLAPWADALVANDAVWWKVRPDAHAFAGRKFSANELPGIEKVPNDRNGVNKGTPSGALSLYVAKRLGAKRILLLGFDHRGDHFFGPHVAPLKNTPPQRWSLFGSYFDAMADIMKSEGIEVFNCTEGSALKCFPMRDIQGFL